MKNDFIHCKNESHTYAIIERSNKDHLLRWLFLKKVYIVTTVRNNVLMTNDLFLCFVLIILFSVFILIIQLI